jgi:hypothetical protein
MPDTFILLYRQHKLKPGDKIISVWCVAVKFHDGDIKYLDEKIGKSIMETSINKMSFDWKNESDSKYIQEAHFAQFYSGNQVKMLELRG